MNFLSKIRLLKSSLCSARQIKQFAFTAKERNPERLPAHQALDGLNFHDKRL